MIILQAVTSALTRVVARRERRATTFGERVIEAGLFGCAALSILVTVGIVAVLAYETVEFFKAVPFARFFGDTVWTPLFHDAHFGIWPLVCGTLLTAGVAIGVALPFGLLAAIYLSELASKRVRSIVKPTLELLAGVPTIVYGYFALTFVTPLLQGVVPGLAGSNALSAGLVMGIMIIPMISSLAEDAIYAVPNALREGAYALGAAKLPTIWRVVVPSAFSGIAAAVTLAVSRAIGETMIVVIAAGNQPGLTLDPRQPIQTLTAYITAISKGDAPYGSLAHRALFAVGAVLFVMTLVMNLMSVRLASRLRLRSAT
jgi:phosphate transport system permease protein